MLHWSFVNSGDWAQEKKSLAKDQNELVSGLIAKEVTTLIKKNTGGGTNQGKKDHSHLTSHGYKQKGHIKPNCPNKSTGGKEGDKSNDNGSDSDKDKNKKPRGAPKDGKETHMNGAGIMCHHCKHSRFWRIKSNVKAHKSNEHDKFFEKAEVQVAKTEEETIGKEGGSLCLKL